jgi:TPR repeat protein
MQDYAEAKRWYEKAAAAGDLVAMNNIGMFYRNGNGVTQDYAEAKRWYEKAATAGNSAWSTSDTSTEMDMWIDVVKPRFQIQSKEWRRLRQSSKSRSPV